MVPGCTLDFRKIMMVLGMGPNSHDFDGLPENLDQKETKSLDISYIIYGRPSETGSASQRSRQHAADGPPGAC